MKTTRPLSAKGLLARSMDELRRRSAIAWNLEAIKGPAGPRLLYDFCDEESVQDCIVMSDNRIGGSSQSNLDFTSPSSTSPSLSVANHATGCSAGWTSENKVYRLPMDGLPLPSAFARFHGHISTALPTDRPNVHRSGFAAFRTPDQSASLFGNSVWDVDPYTYLALRVKSDGRAYFLNLQTEGIEPSDLHQHRLFARYPGQWETIMVKWNDFVRTNHGSVVEPQSEILRQKISTFGIGLTNRIEGPFELCIEKVWATNETFDDSIVITPKKSQLQSRSGKNIYWRRDQLNPQQRQPLARVEGLFMAHLAKAFQWAIDPTSQSYEQETVSSGESQSSRRKNEIMHPEKTRLFQSAEVGQGSEVIGLAKAQSRKSVAPVHKNEAHCSEESQSLWKSKTNTAQRGAKQPQSKASQVANQQAQTKFEENDCDERGLGMGKHVRSRRRRVTKPPQERSHENTMQSIEKRHKGSIRDVLMQSMTSQIRQSCVTAVSDDLQLQNLTEKPTRSSATQCDSSLIERAMQGVETLRKDGSQDKMKPSRKIQHQLHQRRRDEETEQWEETLQQMGSAEVPRKENILRTEFQCANGREGEVARSVQFKHQSLNRKEPVLKSEIPREMIMSAKTPHEEMILSTETREKTILSREIPREDAFQWAETLRENSQQNKTTSSTGVQENSHGHGETMSKEETLLENMLQSTDSRRKEAIELAGTLSEDTAETLKTMHQVMLPTETSHENFVQLTETPLQNSPPPAKTQDDHTTQPAAAAYQKTIPSITTQGVQTVPSMGISHETKLPVETQREQVSQPPETPHQEAAQPREVPGQEATASATRQTPEMLQTAEMRCNEIMRLAEMQCRNIMQSVETHSKEIPQSAEIQGEQTMRPTGERCGEMQHEETAQETQAKERPLEGMQVREMLQSAETSREEKQGRKTQGGDRVHGNEAAHSSGGVQAAPSHEAQSGSDSSYGEAGQPSQGQGQSQALRNRKGEVVRW